ncbi:MarR family transcriptional regulator [Microtetraspora sp. AC03309]|uniref:MarR family transcriptional regulator n=1 Tax=Microtetraspora sp. AC03309 TaxID=2779376 RepID=UPI001E54C2A1|nr:helix-turn-helix domain-containing protein [Microtetraspora sp. AC03309]MCC5579244.1 MarR family transcriptional regulator [Microtetraspora sp. AC03309]
MPSKTAREKSTAFSPDTSLGTTENAPTVTADAPDGVTPDQDTRAVNGPTDTVWAALMAYPGMSAVKIGAVAGMSRAAASKILTSLEADGRATRTPGGYEGGKRIPDAWYAVALTDEITNEPSNDVADTPPTDVSTAPEPDSVTAEDQKAGVPLTVIDQPMEVDASAGHESAEAVPGEAEADDPSPSEPDEKTSGDTPAALDDVSQPASSNEAAFPDASESLGPGTLSEPCEVPRPHDEDNSGAKKDDSDAQIPEAGSEPVVSEAWAEARRALIQLAELALGTVEAAESGDLATALGRLELMYGNAGPARRDAKAALTGTGRRTKTTGTEVMRPGQLRDRVLAHLTAHPGQEFTPYEIGRVLGNSSGAVSNALDRLVSLGQAELTSEQPRKFTAADQTTAATR